MLIYKIKQDICIYVEGTQGYPGLTKAKQIQKMNSTRNATSASIK